MKHQQKIKDILLRANNMLIVAERGYSDLAGEDPAAYNSGLMNVATFGRAVTNVLQNLRSVVEHFDDWYMPKQEEMRSSPVCRHFYKIRSDILKRGESGTSVTVHLFSSPGTMDELIAAAGAPPTDNAEFVIGGRFSGSGWLIRHADGSEDVFYVSLPEELAITKVVVSDTAREESVRGKNIVDLAREYLDYLRLLVQDAKHRFSS